MARWRVLRGLHQEDSRTYMVGDVFESHKDLARHNSAGSVKFERVPDETPTRDEAIAAAAEQGFSNGNTAPLPDALELKTVKELRAMADEEEIDLGGATAKADIIAKIRAATS